MVFFVPQHCDKIIGGYSGMSKKQEGKSHFIARIVGDGVTLLPNSKNSGSVITFDRDPPKVYQVDILTIFLYICTSM